MRWWNDAGTTEQQDRHHQAVMAVLEAARRAHADQVAPEPSASYGFRRVNEPWR